MKGLRAHLISIGDELTAGLTVDTNSAWLAKQLSAVGIDTTAHATVNDEGDAITATIARSVEQADLVIVTGGLGPTCDDITRHSIAACLGVDLQLDEASLAEIEAFFARRNRPMIDLNRIQAMIPAGCDALANPCGTAPGIAAKFPTATLYALPGVPSEMKALFAAHIAPRLPQQTGAIVHRLIRAFGTGESNLAERIADLMPRTGPVRVGTTVSDSLISVRLTSKAPTPEEADAQTRPYIDAICDRLGPLILGLGDQASVQKATAQLLTKAGQTLATAESCTGGLIGKLLTDLSGSSQYYLGGVIAYANHVKRDQLGVPESMLIEHGAVSEPVAETLARNVRKTFAADWGIATTGIAGPTGGAAEKPVGLVFTALASPSGQVEVTRHLLAGSRGRIRQQAALKALNALRLALRQQMDKQP